MSYQKITKDHPAYKMVEARKRAGLWVCDAVTHNGPKGCTNPNCFNFKYFKLINETPSTDHQQI